MFTFKGFQGCARFPEILQNFSKRQILESLCLIVFHALTLKQPIQTSLSVAPKLPLSLCSGEIVQISGKRAHPRDVLVFLKFGLKETWSSGATECRV